MSHPSLVDALRALAAEAGARIMAVYRKPDLSVQAKADNSPLTEADRAAHACIVDGLRGLTPDWPVLSEEASDIDWSMRRQWTRYWLVDPLDGTREFINKNGEFTVNIALVEGNRPVLGVVYAPAQDRMYWAAEGAGAWLAVGDSASEPIRVQPRKPGAPWRVVGSRSHAGDSLRALLECLGDCRLVPMGSSLKLCLVAEGRADLYPRLGPTSEWDTAAAQCIVEQAGGRVVTANLRPLEYNGKDSLLNPHFIVSAGPVEDWSDCLAHSRATVAS
ncbi:MAG: 3'(2'),5'-bisphosphate nucleotidase CysQ [Halothiobacillaceae bacterium]